MTLSFRRLGGSFGGFFPASWGPLGAFRGPLGGFLEASWGVLGGPLGPFGGSGGRLEVKHHFGGLECFGNVRLGAVLASFCRFL